MVCLVDGLLLCSKFALIRSLSILTYLHFSMCNQMMGKICRNTTRYNAVIADESFHTHSLRLCTRILDHHSDTEIHTIHNALHHSIPSVNCLFAARACDLFLPLWHRGTSESDEQYPSNLGFRYQGRAGTRVRGSPRLDILELVYHYASNNAVLSKARDEGVS